MAGSRERARDTEEGDNSWGRGVSERERVSERVGEPRGWAEPAREKEESAR
jgi:hypothetical protein